MTESTEVAAKRRGRGPGKKPTLVGTSIRLSKDVMDYFNQHHPFDKQKKMRQILSEYVNNHSITKEPSNGSQETVNE